MDEPKSALLSGKSSRNLNPNDSFNKRFGGAFSQKVAKSNPKIKPISDQFATDKQVS